MMTTAADLDALRPRPPHPATIRIVALWMTTGGYPTQWEGWDHEGYAVYIRYRGGHLEVRRGHDDDDLFAREPVWETTGLDLGGGGVMESSELVALLPGSIAIAPDAFARDVTLDGWPGERERLRDTIAAREGR